jgi:fido (protein-threonine AMPylation protein)
MPHWDANSPELEANLQFALRTVRGEALRRARPTLALARMWHALMMKGLTVPKPQMVGRFRGETGLENCNVAIGKHRGVNSKMVVRTLAAFVTELQTRVAQLDRLVPSGAFPSGQQMAQVIDLAAWTHAEWVRIHAFANGNGRIARLWANFIVRRYGLPFFVRLRPRPGLGYNEAGEMAMRGRWQPTAACFRLMLREFLARGTSPH